MTKNEITTLLLRECRKQFAQVAEPQYYDDEGPFIIALDEESVFYCYAIADAEEFLSDPHTFPQAFLQQEFFYSLADNLDLRHIKHTGNYYKLIWRLVVPDIPACRIQLQQLWQLDADSASNITLLSESGIMSTGKDILDQIVLLS